MYEKRRKRRKNQSVPLALPIGRGTYGVVNLDPADPSTCTKTYTDPDVFAEMLSSIFMQQLCKGDKVPAILKVFANPYRQLCVRMLYGGRSLHTLVHLHGPFVGPKFAQIANQVLEAAQFIWSRGIIHGDWKLDNVVMDANGRIMVIDFDLAEAQGRDYSKQSLLYAPAVRAPELLATTGTLLTCPTGYEWSVLSEYWAVGMVLLVVRAGFNHDDFYASYQTGCTTTERLAQLLAMFAQDDDINVYLTPPQLGRARVVVPDDMSPYMSLLRLNWTQRRLPLPVSFGNVIDEPPWKQLNIEPPPNPRLHRHLVDVLDRVCDDHTLSWRLRVMARILVDAVHGRFQRTPTRRLVLATVHLGQALCRVPRLPLDLYPDVTQAAVDNTMVKIANAISLRLPIAMLAFVQNEEHFETLHTLIDRAPEEIGYYVK